MSQARLSKLILSRIYPPFFLFSFVTKVRFGGNRQNVKHREFLKKEKMDDFFNPAPVSENTQTPVAEATQVADPAADFLGGDVAAVADINEAPEELTIGKRA